VFQWFKATGATQSKKKRVFGHFKTSVDLAEQKVGEWKHFLRDFRKSMQNKEVCTLWGKSKMAKMITISIFGHQNLMIFATVFTFS